jgi:aldose sugar dehydrogenase
LSGNCSSPTAPYIIAQDNTNKGFLMPHPVIALLIFVLSPLSVMAQIFETEELTLEAETIASGLSHPWGMSELPDGSILVTERGGALWRIAEGEKTRISGVPQVAAVGQGGLLDIAADENFEQNRKVYFTWSEAGEGGYSTALSSAVLSSDNERLENLKRLFTMAKKTTKGQHFGSRIVLAPDDKLFMTMGDRGEAERAQDLSDHAGSVIRLNRDGSIPPDNPFVDNPDALDELWSKGHRNPQGADWHVPSGTLWTVEHGARGGDEINRPQAGRNYGWPVISYGRHYSGAKIGKGQEAGGYEQPLWYWDPSIAPSGMAFYDGDLIPEWQGDILVGALKFQLLARLDLENGEIVDEERLLEDEFGRIRDVDVFSDGAVYLLTDEPDGQLLRLAPAD